jgi:hypothetical protein
VRIPRRVDHELQQQQSPLPALLEAAGDIAGLLDQRTVARGCADRAANVVEAPFEPLVQQGEKQLFLAVYFVRPRGRAMIAYLGIWAVIFPIQCIVVFADGNNDPLYWIFNAMILAGGIGLNRLGGRFRDRRRGPASGQAAS